MLVSTSTHITFFRESRTDFAFLSSAFPAERSSAGWAALTTTHESNQRRMATERMDRMQMLIPYAKASSIPRKNHSKSVEADGKPQYSMEEPVFSRAARATPVRPRRTQSVFVGSGGDAGGEYLRRLQRNQNQMVHRTPTIESLDENDDAGLGKRPASSYGVVTPSATASVPAPRPPRRDSVMAHVDRLKAHREKKIEEEAYANARLEKGIVPRPASASSALTTRRRSISQGGGNGNGAVVGNSGLFQTPVSAAEAGGSTTYHQRGDTMATAPTPASTLMMPTGRPRRRSTIDKGNGGGGFSFGMSSGKTISANTAPQLAQAAMQQSARRDGTREPATSRVRLETFDEVSTGKEPPQLHAETSAASLSPSLSEPQKHEYQNPKLSQLSHKLRGTQGAGGENGTMEHITKLVDRVITLEAELRTAHEKVMYLETERSSLVAEVEEWKLKGAEWSQLVSKWVPIFAEIKAAGFDTTAPTMQHAAKAFMRDSQFVTGEMH